MDFSFLQHAVESVTFQAPTTGVCLAAALVVFLLGVSAFASGSEIAFFSLSPSDLNGMDPEKNAKDANINILRDDSERTLATILVTNNFVNVTVIMLCNYVFGELIKFGKDAYWLQFLCITVLLTFLLLLFGEIMPKVFARQDPLSFCRRVVGGIMFVRKLFWPVETLLLRSGVMAERMLSKDSHVLSVDELGQALELTDNDAIRDEKSMLQGIIRFGDETVKEIMTSRKDVVDIDINAPFSQVLKCVVDNNYSRIPVYQDNSDNIKGVLYIKDLLLHIGKPDTFRWQGLIRAPYFVPETKKVDDMLREFQSNRVHIAIVVDEFGGTCGIVTLEDVLEEIVGEIQDEYDDDEKNYRRVNNNTYIFVGKTLLSDFTRIMNVPDSEFADVEGEADTIAGLLLELKGDFPSLHEKFEIKDFLFEVLEISERRITSVKVVVRSKKD